MACFHFNGFGIMGTKSKRIKILFTIPNFDTAGSGKALMNIALGLNSEKFEPMIACLHDQGAYFNQVKASGLPVFVFNYLAPARPVFQLLSKSWTVSRKFREINPDIIHSFHYSSDYSEAIAACMAGIPWIYTKKNMGWFGPSIRAWKLRTLLARHVLAQNTDMLRHFFPGKSKVSLVPRGVNASYFSSSAPDNSIRRQMGTDMNNRLLICVANFVPVKGIEVLIDAFEMVSDVNEDWVLWLVGDNSNEYGKFLQSKASQTKVANRIKFSGKQADVRPFLNHAEIFVLPTLDEGRREGSPVALLEAMANSKYVIGSNVPGIRDQLRDFPDSLFVAGDRTDLAEKLRKLFLNDSSMNIELGQLFYQHVCKNYTIEREIGLHEQVYFNVKNAD